MGVKKNDEWSYTKNILRTAGLLRYKKWYTTYLDLLWKCVVKGLMTTWHYLSFDSTKSYIYLLIKNYKVSRNSVLLALLFYCVRCTSLTSRLFWTHRLVGPVTSQSCQRWSIIIADVTMTAILLWKTILPWKWKIRVLKH